MKIFVFLVLITISSATIHKLFKPRRVYKHVVKPLVGFALQGSHDDTDGDYEEEHDFIKKKHHHHKKHKEIIIYHHVPHYHHMEPLYHGGSLFSTHQHQPFHYGHQPLYSGYQQFHSGHQQLHSGHQQFHGHIHHVHPSHEPFLEGGVGGLYGGTIGFHDNLIGHGGEPIFHEANSFGTQDLHHAEGQNSDLNHLSQIH